MAFLIHILSTHCVSKLLKFPNQVYSGRHHLQKSFVVSAACSRTADTATHRLGSVWLILVGFACHLAGICVGCETYLKY